MNRPLTQLGIGLLLMLGLVVPSVSLAVTPTPAPTPQATTRGCDTAAEALYNRNLLPVLPREFIQSNCTPQFWTVKIFKAMLFRTLLLLNWLAGAIAVILTVYAGVLYVMGFQSDANIKRAKGILIAAYVGLTIVFTARIILYGTIQTVSNRSVEDGLKVDVNLDGRTP